MTPSIRLSGMTPRRTAAALALLIATAMAGCASPPTGVDTTKADYGPVPTNAEQLIRAHHRKILTDPDSARYVAFSRPTPAWWGDPMKWVKYGYRVCVTFNARGPAGGYTGIRSDAVLIKDGVIIDYVPNGRHFGQRLC
jgi:hypothetical protein